MLVNKEYAMTDKQVKASKTISYALRHNPAEFGLTLDSEGWVDCDKFIAALAKHRQPVYLTKTDIAAIIAGSGKKRFEIRDGKIRATYGHSTAEKIKFEPSVPLETLYHGTARRFVSSIEREGLKPMNRQYVHLSSDLDTAVRVGKRHDSQPVIFEVQAGQMHRDGVVFYHSGNDGTWMCEAVEPKYIRLPCL